MKKQMKQTKNINIIFDKKNICSYNISIATLEMLNNLLLLENLVSFDFPFSWLSAEGGYLLLWKKCSLQGCQCLSVIVRDAAKYTKERYT